MARGKPWTREHDAVLARYWAAGTKGSVIAMVLGRTLTAIYSRTTALGLAIRETRGNEPTTPLDLWPDDMKDFEDDPAAPTGFNATRAVRVGMLGAGGREAHADGGFLRAGTANRAGGAA